MSRTLVERLNNLSIVGREMLNNFHTGGKRLKYFKITFRGQYSTEQRRSGTRSQILSLWKKWKKKKF